MIGLQLNITPTERYATVDCRRCRAWDGLTPLGSSCTVYVAWLDVPGGQDTREFDALPTEIGPPTIVDRSGLTDPGPRTTVHAEDR